MNIVLRVTAGPHAGQEYVFDRHDNFVVGRSSQVHFPVVDDPFLSRDHFMIEFNPPICSLKDMGSTNGTKVNGQRVEGGIRLGDGDTISAGKSSFLIQVQSTLAELPRIRCLACGKDAPGDLAVITVEGLDGSWPGTVEEVPDRVADRALRPDDPGRPSDTSVLRVKVAPEAPLPLKLGQQVEVEIRKRPSSAR